MLALLLSMIFAFALGFSAHRAGICSVAAVGEVLTSGTARTFLSFFKVVVWVVLINSVALIVSPELQRAYQPSDISPLVALGGFLFGVGAAVNGGCSFSTISKLAQGNLHVALTLPAFVLGALTCWSVGPSQTAYDLPVAYWLDFSALPRVLVAVLLLWGVFELTRLARFNLTEGGAFSALLAKRYRLSSAAALVGICSGFLYLLHGRWAYSSRIMDGLTGEAGDPGPGMSFLYLMGALITGAATSAVLNGEWKLSFAADKWHRNLSGGFLMGFGALMVPGGNGKLILQDLPHLSIAAALAYLAMVLGIALVLLVQMKLLGQVEIVTCSGDECRISKE